MNATTLAAADGTPLAVRFFAPDDGTPRRGAVLIGGAMGVRQDYYRPFAEWLARQGFVVASFDYRGMGESRPAG
ncbi:MAG TPA: alpha/beta hydrolase, partial [Piscinibacter sp.]|nr:alpha/beta hydrolase [Piscinibacter sp.]